MQKVIYIINGPESFLTSESPNNFRTGSRIRFSDFPIFPPNNILCNMSRNLVKKSFSKQINSFIWSCECTKFKVNFSGHSFCHVPSFDHPRICTSNLVHCLPQNAYPCISQGNLLISLLYIQTLHLKDDVIYLTVRILEVPESLHLIWMRISPQPG